MSVCIRVEDLHKTFRSGFLQRKSEVLRGVSLEVHEGEIFGFLGPNGSGKTTTLKILLGIIFATKGSATIFDRPIKEVSFKQKVGYLPDSPYFYNYLTAFEFLNFYGQLFGLKKSVRIERIESLLDLVDLAFARKMQLRKFSKGMLQRIGLAQALINDPSLVIMDEPMEGVDPIGRKLIRDIIVRLRNEGKTVFFSTHILSDAELICDRVAIMVKGKVQGQGLLVDLLSAKVQSVDVSIRESAETELAGVESEFGNAFSQGKYTTFNVQEERVEPLLTLLMKKKIGVVSIVPHQESLEQLFMSEVR